MNEGINVTPFHLTQADGNITKTNGVANTWSDIFKYQVPQNTEVLLQPGDLFSAYLKDTSPAECGEDTCYVKIEVRDPSENDHELVFGAATYKRIKEFQNRNEMAKIVITTARRVLPRQWIVIVIKDDAVVSYATSYFDLFTSMIAVPLT